MSCNRLVERLGFDDQVTQHFLDRREAFRHQNHGILLKALHSVLHGEIVNDVRIRTARYGALELVTHREQFVKAHAALVAGTAAPFTAFALEERWR